MTALNGVPEGGRLDAVSIKGVQFISDPDGRKKAVVLDLARHGRVWEDVYDTLVARSRRNEPRVSWEDVKKRLALRRSRRG